jgi:AcrB/AcrD/AcrF family protein
MTAFAFILGVVPLVIATSAGAASRSGIGVTVFAGMLAATVIGIMLIPALIPAHQRAETKERETCSVTHRARIGRDLGRRPNAQSSRSRLELRR